mgnify:CR=1 FL=1
MNKNIDDILNEYKKLAIWETCYLMLFVSLIVFIVLVTVESNKLLYGILLVINIFLFAVYGTAIKKQRVICESLKRLLYIVADE